MRITNTYDNLLVRLEKIRIAKLYSTDPAEYTVRLCQAEVAELAGYKNRADWQEKISQAIEREQKEAPCA